MKSNKRPIIGIIIILAIIIFVGIIVGNYNSIVSKEEVVSQKMADIDTNLQRRADLIPNLVSTVKGYAAHEQNAIDSVTKARSKLLNAKTMEDKANANEALTSSLNNLIAIVEAYPDLKANQNFIQLQDELAGTENRISVSRKDYNESVKTYNAYIKKVPTNVIANLFGFDAKDYFRATKGANEVPEVSFE